MSLTLNKAALDLISKLGVDNITDPTTASIQIQEDVITALNGAGQWLQRAGEDFFTRTTITQALTAGTAQYLLSENMQSVIGPIRLNNQVPMAALRSRGELDQFDRIFLGQADYGAAGGTPIAYWVESVYASGGFSGDIAAINIWVAPTPNTGGNTLYIECIQEFPSLTISQFVSGPTDTSILLPVAQNYAETIYMPIARYLIMLSSQFSRPDLRDQITEQYKRALDELSTAGGFPDATQVHGDRANIGSREVNA